MNGSAGKVLSGQGLSALYEGIDLILSRWTALNAAVENEWGGPNSRGIAEQAFSNIFALFTTQSKEHCIAMALEKILDHALEDLKTIVEDGSDDEVARKLTSLYEECLEGNYETVEKLRVSSSQMPTRANIVKDPNVSDDDDEEDSDGNGHETSMMVDESEDPSHSNMRVDEPAVPKLVAQDEDGWTVVLTRHNKGRKN